VWRGIELHADGSYELLTENTARDLVPAVALSNDGGADVPSLHPSVGNYEVVDGSATFGAGSYEIRLHPAEGGLAYGQIAVSDSPRQVHFFAPGFADAPLAPSLPWAPFSPACQCVDAVGTKVNPNDANALRTAITGRWLGCAGIVAFGGPGSVGLEFDASGTWYPIVEDQTGALVRGDAAGTYDFVSTAMFNSFFVGPEPLSMELGRGQGGGNTLTQVIVTTEPRAMQIVIGSMYSGSGPTQAIWQPMMPLP
jgi:hypothetical protein